MHNLLIPVTTAALALLPLLSCRHQEEVSDPKGGITGTSMAGFAKVRKHCIEWRDWSRQKIHIKDLEGEEYDRDPTSDMWAAASNKYAVTAVQAVSRLATFYRAQAYLVEDELKTLNAELKAVQSKLPDDEWKELRTACIAKCASANIIKYSNDFKTKLSCPTTIVEQGTGECTEFATLGKYFGENLGVVTRKAGSTGHTHSFNHFYIKSKEQWFYAEPQNEFCEFEEGEKQPLPSKENESEEQDG